MGIVHEIQEVARAEEPGQGGENYCMGVHKSDTVTQEKANYDSASSRSRHQFRHRELGGPGQPRKQLPEIEERSIGNSLTRAKLLRRHWRGEQKKDPEVRFC